jgi:tetratricopeptide (TPR) repeat protein
VRDLARAYTLAGRISDALHWLHSAVRKAKGQSSHLTIESIWLLNSLGIMYDQQKEFGMSLDTQLEALEIQRRELPPDHLDTVWTMNELGRVYYHLGLSKDVKKMHMQALSILDVQFKESNPQIIWTKACWAEHVVSKGAL